MSLVAGADGQKSVFKDGLQVDIISENTVGHGVRVKGVTDPITYPVLEGDVGEVKTSTVSTFAAYTASGTFENITTIPLTAGSWSVGGNIEQAFNNSTSPANLQLAISGYSGGTQTDHVKTLNLLQGIATQTNSSNAALSCAPFLVRCNGSNIYIGGLTIAGTTLYLKSACTYTGTAPQRTGTITAIRIA